MLVGHDSNLFFSGGFPYIEISTAITAVIGLMLIKFAPADATDISLKVAVSSLYSSWVADVCINQFIILTFS